MQRIYVAMLCVLAVTPLASKSGFAQSNPPVRARDLGVPFDRDSGTVECRR